MKGFLWEAQSCTRQAPRAAQYRRSPDHTLRNTERGRGPGARRVSHRTFRPESRGDQGWRVRQAERVLTAQSQVRKRPSSVLR